MDFKTIKAKDSELNVVQSNVQTMFKYLNLSVLKDAMLLENVSIDTGLSVGIPHKLGRKPKGYIVVKQNAEANIWFSDTTENLEKLYLTLNSSANVIVSLIVF